jgi:sugar phosphate permease
MLLSRVDNYASFLLVYLGVISLAFIAGFVHSPMVIANSWFIRHRARAMTVVSAAVPVGGALISPVLAIGVQALGWRSAAFAAGCIFLAVCLPLSFQVRRSPESMGLMPDGDPPPDQVAAGLSANTEAEKISGEKNLTAAQAMKTAVFWLLVTSMTTRVAAYSTVSVHFVPIMVWQGLSQEQAAFLLAAFAFINLAAHFVLGWIGDRVNKPGLMSLCHIVPALSVLPLLGEAAYWQLWLFTTTYTFLDASFPLVWATVGDFFGRKHFATIRGMLSFFYMWGSFAGPVLAGAIYDRSQTYANVVWVLFVLLVVATLLNVLLIVPWQRRMSARQST